MIVSEDRAAALAAALLKQYRDLAKKNRIQQSVVAESLGMSRAYWSALSRNPAPVLKAHTFLSLVQGIEAVTRGVDEGWLPATAARGGPQSEVARRLCGG